VGWWGSAGMNLGWLIPTPYRRAEREALAPRGHAWGIAPDCYLPRQLAQVPVGRTRWPRGSRPPALSCGLGPDHRAHGHCRGRRCVAWPLPPLARIGAQEGAKDSDRIGGKGDAARHTSGGYHWRPLRACGEGHEHGDAEDVREIISVMSSSIGCLRTSRTWRRNSARLSKKRTPWWARDTSPGIGP
jgi:hypothetical protein